MPLRQSIKPILYPITGGATTPATNPNSPEFARILTLIRAWTDAGLPLIQLREKNLNALALYELAARSAEIVKGSHTRLLINDRADVALAARADGVHLTTQSLSPDVIRQKFGEQFLIGVSAHSINEARAARGDGADFVVFGPIFDTPSKRAYGSPLGISALREAARSLHPFPVIAIGGVTLEDIRETLRTGAAGVAAIRLFEDANKLDDIMRVVNECA